MSISTFVAGCSAASARQTSSPCTLGQVAVEHDDVVRHDARLVQRRGAVAGDVDRHPLAPQPARHGAGDPGFVLGDQHAHAGHAGQRAMKRRSTALIRT